MNTLIVSALIVLAIGEIIFGGMCIVWIKKLDEEREELKTAREVYEINKKYTDKIIDVEHKFMEDLWDQVAAIARNVDINNKLMNNIYDHYGTICEQHSKLLECWKSIEERYSDCYEQYKRNSKLLEEIIDLMEPEPSDILPIEGTKIQNGVVDFETGIFTSNGTEE